MAKRVPRYRFESPSEKSARYGRELAHGANSITGETLNHGTASYRMGYLNSRRDSSRARKAWRKKHGNN